jgi:hypothetical protein
MPKAKTAEKAKEVKFLKELYGDFKTTMGEVFGDAESIFKKHKLLVIIAFIGFLLYRNKQFTIEQFVNKLEEKLGKDRGY